MLDDNLHIGHRERLRKRFKEEGLDSFEDHQVLELLLFHGPLDIKVLDHIIVAGYQAFSFAREGVLPIYEAS